MKVRVFLLVVLTTLLAPGTAAAKGPAAATVDGDGIAAPVPLDLTDRWDLVEDLAVIDLVYGPAGRRTLEAVAPAGELGPGLVVAWEMMTGPDTTAVVRQDVYPFAEGGPWAHVAPDQVVGSATVHGGWARLPAAVVDDLRAAGAPIDRLVTAAAPGPPAAAADDDRSDDDGIGRPALPLVAAAAVAGVALVRLTGVVTGGSRWRRRAAA